MKKILCASLSPFLGTLRPDLIESASLIASGKAEAIKTHHNDSELVRELRKQVIFFLRIFHLFGGELVTEERTQVIFLQRSSKAFLFV